MREIGFHSSRSLAASTVAIAVVLVLVEMVSSSAGWQPPEAKRATNRSRRVLPLISENDCSWAEARLNDKPTAMIVEPELDVIVVSAAHAAELGLRLRDDAPRARFAVSDGVSVAARRTQIRAIGLGEFTANDVPCLVLNPAAGDMPPWLGLKTPALAAWRLDPLKNELLLEVERASPSPSSSPR